MLYLCSIYALSILPMQLLYLAVVLPTSASRQAIDDQGRIGDPSFQSFGVDGVLPRMEVLIAARM